MKKSHSKTRIAIAVAHFNPEITGKLLKSCLNQLVKKGVSTDHVHIVRVPGAYELPFVAHRLAKSKKYDAVIGLGCVIKGETSHDLHVANWASLGLGLVSLMTDVPTLFGVLTPNNEKQAFARVSAGPLNRGVEIADAAIEMIEHYK